MSEGTLPDVSAQRPAAYLCITPQETDALLHMQNAMRLRNLRMRV